MDAPEVLPWRAQCPRDRAVRRSLRNTRSRRCRFVTDLDARLYTVDELLEQSPERPAPEAPSSGANECTPPSDPGEAADAGHQADRSDAEMLEGISDPPSGPAEASPPCESEDRGVMAQARAPADPAVEQRSQRPLASSTGASSRAASAGLRTGERAEAAPAPERARPAVLQEPAPQHCEDDDGPLLFVRRSPEEYSRLESVESSLTALLRRQASQEDSYHRAGFAHLAGPSFCDFDGDKLVEIKVHLPPYDHKGSAVTMSVPMAMRVADLCQEVLREHRGRVVLAPFATYELRLYDEEDEDADYETPAFDENLRVGCLSTCDLALCPALSPSGTPPSPPLSCPSEEAEDLSAAALTPEDRGILAQRAVGGRPALRGAARSLVVRPGPPVTYAEDLSAPRAAMGSSSSSSAAGDSGTRARASAHAEAVSTDVAKAPEGAPAGGALAWVGAPASSALPSVLGCRIEVPVSQRPPRKSSDPEVGARTAGASSEDSPDRKLHRRVKSMPMMAGGAWLESTDLAMPGAGAAGEGGDTVWAEERRRWSSEDAAGGARSSRQPTLLLPDGSVKQDQSSSSALSAGRKDAPPALSPTDPFSPLRWLEGRSMTPSLESRRPSPASFFFNEYTASIATEYFVTVAARGARARPVECMLVVDRERLYHQVPRGAALQERKGSFMTGVVQSLLPQRSRSLRPDPAIFVTRSVREVRSIFCEEGHERAFTVLYATGGAGEIGSLELTYEAQTPTECAEIVARMNFLLTL